MTYIKTATQTKPSGIPWLGDIPVDWEVRRLKTLSRIIRGASPRPIDDQRYFDENGEFAWVRISDVTASNIYLEKTEQQLSELGANLSVKQYPEDLFLSIAGTVGKPIFAKIKCCIHDGFVAFQTISLSLDKMFLFYILNSGLAYAGLGKEGSQLNLNIDTVANISIPLPPLPTQHRIVEFLDAKTARIGTFIANKKKLIELLKEQKKSLIYNAVTGKIPIPNSFLEAQNSPLEGCPKGGVDNKQEQLNSNSPLEGCPKGGVDPLPTWKQKSLFPFWHLPKNQALEPRAKELRQAGVLSETLFWQAFKNKKLLGWDIDRQVIIGNYIVDFFIAELGLVVEIDGQSHDYTGQHDVVREAYLKSLGLEVIHYADLEVKKSMDFVADSFQLAVGKRADWLRSVNPPRQATPATPQEGNFRTKPSGIPWLGDIPADWEVRRLKSVARIKTGSTPKDPEKNESFVNGSIPWYSPGDFQENLVLPEITEKMINLENNIDNVEIYPENVVFVIGIGATTGKFCISRKESSSNQQLNAIVFDQKLVNPDFGLYYFSSIKEIVLNEANSATLPILNQTLTKNLILPRPPLPTQQGIVAYMDEQVGKLDRAVATIERELELIEEYKKSLIYQAVTGKVEI